jgi:1,2-dihydroxy-3-keto-5-methylthiopentene dioxygenase
MSELRIYRENDPLFNLVYTDHAAIARELDTIGIFFERWQADQQLADNASQEEVIGAYQDSVNQLMDKYGFQSVDVIGVTPDHPDKDALRAKFLDEHTHSDYEVRFFVDGKGLFYIHANDQVYAVLCEKGDFISIPANTTHWFDMGPQPHLKCIRLFTNPEGWVANFTGSDIAEHFPRLEA